MSSSFQLSDEMIQENNDLSILLSPWNYLALPKIVTASHSENLTRYLKGFGNFLIRNLAKLETKNSKPDRNFLKSPQN